MRKSNLKFIYSKVSFSVRQCAKRKQKHNTDKLQIRKQTLSRKQTHKGLITCTHMHSHISKPFRTYTHTH